MTSSFKKLSRIFTAIALAASFTAAQADESRFCQPMPGTGSMPDPGAQAGQKERLLTSFVNAAVTSSVWADIRATMARSGAALPTACLEGGEDSGFVTVDESAPDNAALILTVPPSILAGGDAGQAAAAEMMKKVPVFGADAVYNATLFALAPPGDDLLRLQTFDPATDILVFTLSNAYVAGNQIIYSLESQDPAALEKSYQEFEMFADTITALYLRTRDENGNARPLAQEERAAAMEAIINAHLESKDMRHLAGVFVQQRTALHLFRIQMTGDIDGLIRFAEELSPLTEEGLSAILGRLGAPATAMAPAIGAYNKRWSDDADPAREFLDSIKSARERAAAVLDNIRQQNLERQQKQAPTPAP